MSKTLTRFPLLFIVITFFTVTLYASEIPAYYTASYANVKKVKSKLSKEGFKVLATYSPASKEHLKVIVFTNSKLKALASKKTRGFAAIQRVMIDSKIKTITITNPTYWLKAFMQKDFTQGSDTAINASFAKVFGKLSPTQDVLDEDELANYHFMMAMPYYEDMLEIKSGDKLLSKINPKKKLFELTLANGSTLVGIKMSKSSESFIDKIGTNNAILLPYTLLIENGKAYALHAKYYLALSYPLLSMGQFMDISSTPDTIERKLKKSF